MNMQRNSRDQKGCNPCSHYRHKRCLYVILYNTVRRETVTKPLSVRIGILTEREAIYRYETHASISTTIIYIGWNVIADFIPAPLLTWKMGLHQITIIYKLQLNLITTQILTRTSRRTRFSLVSSYNYSKRIQFQRKLDETKKKYILLQE